MAVSRVAPLSPMLISVVVITYNRARSLRDTLDRLRAQEASGFEYEVVVVDNNSSDGTPDVVSAAQANGERRLRYCFEGRQGQGYARNTGVAAARGDVVAFTDDDVEPEPGWLAALAQAFDGYGADCAYGKVLPRWQAPPPAWLGAYFQSRLAMLDRGDEPLVVTSASQQFVCANMAARRARLVALGGFDVRLGNRGTRLGGEEDTELFERLLASGARIVYTPEAVVYHKVPAERMRPSYFRRWHFEHGTTSAYYLPSAKGRTVFGIPWWALRELAEHSAAYLASLGSSNAERRLMHQMRALYGLGLCAGKLRLALRGGNGSNAA